MSEYKFKVGDEVRIIQRKPGNDTGCEGSAVGLVGFVTEAWGCSKPYCVRNGDNGYYGWFDEDEIELNLVGGESSVNKPQERKTIMGTIASKVQDMLLSATERRRRKYNVTDNAGSITSEGKDLFFVVLAQDDDFMKKVDAYLEQIEKQEKKEQ